MVWCDTKLTQTVHFEGNFFDREQNGFAKTCFATRYLPVECPACRSLMIRVQPRGTRPCGQTSPRCGCMRARQIPRSWWRACHIGWRCGAAPWVPNEALNP